ncbi:MAG: hypothetical protein GF341_06205 [candidate division Zixibacteria bacterium]|nr:hypothetical protein [candidate division Zixibacteria bacterium]
MPMIQINLLPSEYRRRSSNLAVSRSMLFSVAAVVGLVVVLGGISYYQSLRLAGVKQDIAKVEAKTEQMREDIQLVDRLVDVKTRILRRMSAIEKLDRDRAAWVQNMEDLATVIPEFLWISEFRQGEQKSALNTRKQDKNATADSLANLNNKLTLSGFSYTVSSLANFILNLQDSPRFSDVRLNYAKMTDVNERKVYDFQVACQLEPITEDAGGFLDEPATSEEIGAEDIHDDDDMYGAVMDEEQ